ncbi:MAG TPA: DNA primase [Nitrospirae bacterium]|nr:DNA primase [Nitrospirota bacterium]
MPSYDTTLEEIRDRIDIVDLISEYVHLKKTGQNWKGLCPFHTEKTPSFTVSPAKQIYHCFGCGNGGDIFTFLVRYENLAFPEALGILAKKAGVTLQASRKDPVKTGEKETLLNMHKDALGFFQQNLEKNTEATGYLRGRGIDADARKLFSVGYALNSWNALLNYLTHKGYKPDAIKRSGLVVQGSKGLYDTFRDRIIFPIYDLKSDVIAFGGRSIDGSEPKYLNSPETIIFNKRKILYGLNRAKDSLKNSGYALFMEGYLDVISAHAAGFTSAVAPLGTACTQEHGKLMKRFVEEVILAFDSDAAGIKAAKNAAGILLESGLSVRMLPFPQKEDPDSFLRKNGKEAFRALLENPLSVIDFFMRQNGDKRLMAREAIETISMVSDKILQGTYMKILSEKLNVEERYVREEFLRIKKQLKSGYKQPSPKPRTGSGPRPRNESYIIRLLLQLPEKAPEVCGAVSHEDFKDVITRSIFKKIKEGLTDFNQLLSKCEGEEKDFLTDISLRDDIENPEKAINDCIKRLKDNRRDILLRELQIKIKEAELNKDHNLLNELLTQYQDIKSGKISVDNPPFTKGG